MKLNAGLIGNWLLDVRSSSSCDHFPTLHSQMIIERKDYSLTNHLSTLLCCIEALRARHLPANVILVWRRCWTQEVCKSKDCWGNLLRFQPNCATTSFRYHQPPFCKNRPKMCRLLKRRSSWTNPKRISNELLRSTKATEKKVEKNKGESNILNDSVRSQLSPISAFVWGNFILLPRRSANLC